MKIGKLTISDLEELIFKNIKNNNKHILSSGEIGSDCAAIEIGENVLYLSSDPITGTSNEIGKLAININCNDIATTGVSPLGIMLTILAPEKTTKKEIATIMKQAQTEAEKLGVTILGGHTEITNSVNKIVISATSIGIGEKKDFKDKNLVKPGDHLLITKGVGIEGTGIISFEKEDIIEKNLGSNILSDGKDMLNFTSVVKEGVLIGKYSKGMHDVTEGGLLGALWETSSLYNLGILIDYNKIYIHESVKKICNFFDIDPLRLISSGTMLIVSSAENSIVIKEILEKNSISCFDIGVFTESKDKILIKNKQKINIAPPESDELYKVV